MAWPFNFNALDAYLYPPLPEYAEPQPIEGIPQSPVGGFRGAGYLCPATGGIFGTPESTHHGANADVGGYVTPIGDIVRAYNYGGVEPEFFTIGFYGGVRFSKGERFCPPVFEGRIGNWLWYMGSQPLITARAVEGPDGVWTPEYTGAPQEAQFIDTAGTAGNTTPASWFMRPAALGPSPWVSVPADPMDACLFTREELGVVTWDWNGWEVDRVVVDPGPDTLHYNVRGWKRQPIDVPKGSIAVGPGLSGWHRRERVVGSPSRVLTID